MVKAEEVKQGRPKIVKPEVVKRGRPKRTRGKRKNPPLTTRKYRNKKPVWKIRLELGDPTYGRRRKPKALRAPPPDTIVSTKDGTATLVIPEKKIVEKKVRTPKNARQRRQQTRKLKGCTKNFCQIPGFARSLKPDSFVGVEYNDVKKLWVCMGRVDGKMKKLGSGDNLAKIAETVREKVKALKAKGSNVARNYGAKIEEITCKPEKGTTKSIEELKEIAALAALRKKFCGWVLPETPIKKSKKKKIKKATALERTKLQKPKKVEVPVSSVLPKRKRTRFARDGETEE